MNLFQRAFAPLPPTKYVEPAKKDRKTMNCPTRVEAAARMIAVLGYYTVSGSKHRTREWIKVNFDTSSTAARNTLNAALQLQLWLKKEGLVIRYEKESN